MIPTIGIYEELISKNIRAKLDELDTMVFMVEENRVDKAEAAQLLSSYISRIVHTALGCFTGEQSLGKQLQFCNDLISFIDKQFDDIDLNNDLLDTQGSILQAILDKMGKDDKQLKQEFINKFPETGLSVSSLFTGSNADLSLDAELEKEIRSADRIYWIVSFIRWSGLRIFKDVLEQFTSQEGNQLKVITTSYMGATEAKAIDFLRGLPNTEVRISYNTQHERLHAKSYIFERNSGFDTAYIGSSNLSYSALTKGLEWNIKTTIKENKHIIDKAKGTFESYWLHPDFEPYTQDDSRKLKHALHFAKNRGRQDATADDIIPNFKIHPYPYQTEILEKLTAEREIHNSHRNLLVAATGIGKTVIAAFDYKRYRKAHPTQSKLLFVAHRQEILKQSLATFRGVLEDRQFGELWVGDYKADHNEHLFVSVQTFNANIEFFRNFGQDYYQFIIVDEVHHIAASSYRPILNFFDPQILLGLTATPERMDGAMISDDFNHRIAAETRLPDALRLGLLSPFQYFCIADDTVDLRSVNWINGKYDRQELEKRYTADDQRLHLIINAISDYVSSISDTKAIGFCTSQYHAQYMAEKFNEQGLKADYIIAKGNKDQQQKRDQLREKLRSGELNFIFAVDILNEGVDIPEVNTVLFLRPTESLTIFLQQLGRGLRLHEDKECLTVLDFVAQAHEKFNYANKLQALVGKTHHNIEKEIKEGFPHLPFGCAFKMEKTAQKYILDNIQSALYDKRKLKREILNFCNDATQELTLKHFTERYNIEVNTIYKGANTWSTLKAEALKTPLTETEYSATLSKGIKRLLHVNSIKYIHFIEQLLQNNMSLEGLDSEEDSIMAHMFYYDLWQLPLHKHNLRDINHAFAEIEKCTWLKEELIELVEVLRGKVDFVAPPFTMPYACPLEIHARYSRDQLLAAFQLSTPDKIHSSREGVVPIKDKNTELLLVTLNKSDKDFSPSTMYEDYALNESLFHWQSQNNTAPHTPVGRSYINHDEIGKQILLFVREHKKDSFGMTYSYLFLGPVDYVKHHGASPMSITWEMQEPMPAYIWKDTAKMCIG